MKRTILIFLILLSFIFSISSILAQTDIPDGDKPDPPVTLTNPLGEGVTTQTFIGRIIQGILGIVGSLALIMFIYGGFVWMTAAGNAEKVTQGRNVLVWATIGLIVIFTSYALVRFVLFEVIQAPGG